MNTTQLTRPVESKISTNPNLKSVRTTDGYKMIAKAVGTLFLAGMIIGIAGNMIIQSLLATPDYLSIISASSMKLAMGAILLLMTAAGDAAHGILMFPVLKQHNERFAIGYLGFRIINGAFLGIQVLFVLLLIPIGNEYINAGSTPSYLNAMATVSIQANLYAYQIAMIFVGLSCLMLCYMFYRARLLSRFLAVWGLVGYSTLLCGSVLEVLGFNLHSIHTIPGGLWELFIGVWLLVKGFNSDPADFKPMMQN